MNRAGSYINCLSGISAYKAYKPNPLPPFPELQINEEFISLLTKAHNLIGKLDTTSMLLPNIDLFLGSYVRKEALLSSQIEGTQATLEDILNANEEIAVNLDVNDVVNYVSALNFAIEKMNVMPICNRFLCEIHKILLKGVRGQERNPGEFRKSQNWIGGAGSTIQTARYVPPTVEDMTTAMNDLEIFINQSELDIFIKIALVHYQFETIHPFLDGNGRIGRMLIILMLINENILKKPVLYPSLFLKTNQIEYYDRLSEVRSKGNYEQWIKFFIEGIIISCEDSIATIEQINNIINKDSLKIKGLTSSVEKVYEYLKERPIINIMGVSKDLKISFNTASSAIKKLINLGILNQKESKSRDRVFEYSKYLQILKSGT